ncbi:glycerol-3-phosphate dehydrogenase/oxidase [Pseudomaricurvus alkylphenolicus]|uniref:glycerol-3-phosphate dehydrogenase/oxidase n=1 Tax=Pseudomaricurvus alkylphenolicus TaxID=1306991 RepID=UPI0030B8DC11
MNLDRETLWQELSGPDKRHWDIIIVGGGITGAGVLREAARRGLKALLVEQRDFGWGTSSRSSKMVHGGLRYLAQGDLKLTRHSLQERERLLQEAPGLVERMGYYMMLRKGQFPGRWAMSLVLKIYDFIAGIKDNRYYDKETVSGLFPGINQNGLRGACYYTDAVTDDARLVVRVLQEALNAGSQAGVRALNYVKAKSLLRSDGKISGLVLEDTDSGESVELQASVVINATGTWADRLRNEVNPEQRVRPLRGSHLVIPHHRLPVNAVATVMHPRDKRPVFIFPWEGATVVGTTDLDHGQDLDVESSITREEVDYLLQLVDSQFPDHAIIETDVIATYSGVRPVIASDKASSSASKMPSKERRDHAVWADSGLVTVSGGKLTTFRLIAEDALKAAEPWLRISNVDVEDNAVFRTAQTHPAQVFADDIPRAKRLLGRLGDDCVRFFSEANPCEHQRIASTDYCLAECRWSVRNESVQHLDDLLLRRTRLGLLLKNGGVELFDKLREMFRDELGWNTQKWQSEQERYQQIWCSYYSLPQ